jgi:hypothetical protein
VHGQVTYAHIEEAHNQVEGLRERLMLAVARREAGVLPSASPQPPPATSESAHSQEGDTSSESSAVLISPEDALSEYVQ